MTRAAPVLSKSNYHVSSRVNRDTGADIMSSRKFSERKDVLTYRQHFALVWQRFVRENFDSPAHAAHVFQVDPTTAINWWNGTNAPAGWVVGRAFESPGLRKAYLSARAGEA